VRTQFCLSITLFCFSVAVFSQQPAAPPQNQPPAQAQSGAQTATPAQPNAAAQPPAGGKAAVDPALNHRIWLDVVVTDKAGNPQPGLQQQDFSILDDKLPLKIASFRAVDGSGPAEPLRVIMLLDAVNTGVQTLAFARLELEKFLRQDNGHLALPTSMVFFTDTATEVQPATTLDGNALADLVASKETGLRISGRAQGIYGAMDRVNLSITALKRLISYEATQPGRKLLVWFSPGWAFLSGPRIDLTKKNQEWLFNNIVGLSRELRESRITLYSVDPLGSSEAGSFRTSYYKGFLKGAPSAEKVQAGDLALQVLATQSGGKALNSNNDLTQLIASCVVDAKAYYTLAFDAVPADHPDEYHNLDVKVDKPGLTARTRTGYYAQPYKEERK
jgi:VWFA-related protein